MVTRLAKATCNREEFCRNGKFLIRFMAPRTTSTKAAACSIGTTARDVTRTGAGGIGPPLIKQQWIYGGEPANVFDTIVKGRPNGMPSWGGRIPEYQIWQIVAFVESLNQKQPQSTISPRQDTIEQSPENIKNKVQGETR